MIIYPDPSGGEKGDGVRPPPQPPVTVRTMNSDVTSMQNNGGGAPQEEVLNAPRPPIRPEPPKFPENDVTIKIPGYSGPEKSVFPTGSFPSNETPEPPAMISTQNNEQVSSGGSMKKVIALIVVIIAAVGVGAAFYFIVFPMLLGQTPTPSPTGEPTPAPTLSPSPVTSSPTASTHISFIKAAQIDASALSEVPVETVATGQTLVKEILLKRNGVPVKLSEYFPTLIPEISSTDLQNIFDEDFTTFIYYNASGSWSGYIFKLKSGASAVVAQNSFRKIENSKSIKKLFLSGAGDQQGQFKNGGYKEVSTHYLLFGNNAAINYGWVDNYLLLTTNFQSLKDLIDGGLIKSGNDNGPISSPTPSPQASKNPTSNLDVFPDKLSTCTKYKTTFIHPMTSDSLQKEILGIVSGKCSYVEQMPNGGKMECNYTESQRKAIAQYYKDIANAKSAGTSATTDLSNGNQKITYTIDGKVVSNPLQEAMNDKTCIVSGY